HQRLLARHVKQGRAADDEEGPQALAAVKAGITHCIHKSPGTKKLARYWLRREQLVEEGLDIGCVVRQQRLEIIPGNAHSSPLRQHPEYPKWPPNRAPG